MTDIDDHCRAAKAHIEKGDQAKGRAEQHYSSAAQHIKEIKKQTPDQAAFLDIVKLRIGLGKSRTYELLQIADGTKTVAEVREDANDRKIKHRDNLSVPERTEPEDDDLPTFLDRTKPRAITHAPPADDMPTAEEANESYQNTLYDHARLIVDKEMSGETRQRFFAHLERKYNAICTQSPTQSRDEGLPA